MKHCRAAATPCSIVTSSLTLPSAMILPSASGNWPEITTRSPVRTKGT